MGRVSTLAGRIGVVAAVAGLTLAVGGCQSSSKSAAAGAAMVASTAGSAAAGAGSASTSAAGAATSSAATTAAVTTTSASAVVPSGAASSSAGSKGGAGTNCGLEESTPNPDNLYLVIVSGSVTCAAAQKQMTDYLAYPDKQGSGGFATVNGWDCDHNSLAGFEEDGHYAECSGKDGDIVTQTATAKTSG